MYLNKVTIAGRVTRQPELRTMPGGGVVTGFSVATNTVYTDKSGQRQENAEFHNIVVFGKIAENCAQYLEKGQLVLLEGKLQTRSWENEGVKRYKTEIVADNVQFGPRANGARLAPGDEAGTGVSKTINEWPKDEPKVENEPIDTYPTGPNPEDIPF